MAVLRWTLAELRRRLGLPEALTGNPLSGDLGAGVEIDIDLASLGSFEGSRCAPSPTATLHAR